MLAKKILFCASLLTLFFITPLARAESDGEISDTHPLNINEPIFRLSVSGRVTFEKESSYFRIVLVDKDLNEYLVYETCPLLADSNSFAFNDVCQETCVLNSVSPVSLKIFGEGVTYVIDKIFSVDDLQKLRIANVTEEKEKIKAQQEEQKIQKLNEQIKVKGMNWVAGKTSVSGLSYAEKKRLFTNRDGTPVDILPNLQGFEYYKGGIFEIKSGSPGLSAAQEASPSALPASWDWRNVHGENWNTPIRDQGVANTCWAYAHIGSMEAQINLYFNQHLNVDLSEQMLVDCTNGFELPLGMNPSLYEECTGPNSCFPGGDYCVIGIHGIADENCDPYVSRDMGLLHCNTSYVCNDWLNRIWKISDFHDYKFGSDRGTPNCPKQTINLPEDDFKKVLITKGPMSSGITQWSHAMLLVGYQERTDWKTIQSCLLSEFCDPTVNECVPIECNAPGEEKTICFNNHKYNNSLLITYKCELSPYAGFQKYEWVKEDYNPRACPTNTKCVNNMCRAQEEYSLFERKRECSLLGYRDFPREISVYAPQSGDNYWIFKNSWGVDWGENGYAKIDASLTNLGWGSLPLGPVIPPPGQSYQIACVDKDNDGYCNWGISENKPDVCPAFCKPQKDCDDSNPNLGPFDENLNCTPICLLRSQGDLNCDELINETDLTILLGRWGQPDNPTIQTLLQNWNVNI